MIIFIEDIFKMRNVSKNILFFLFIILMPKIAMAYVGPGAGISAFGSLIALIAVILIAIIGFIYFPLKRLFGKKRLQQADFDDFG